MDTIPRNDFSRQHRFDAFCKAVLRNEAKDYLRELGRQRDREKSLEALTQQELNKLSTVDQYPSDSYIFSSHGYDLLINNELVAEAFASLPEQEQSILILHCVLEMADGEIGSLMGMSRSAVQRHRTSTLKQRETDGVNAGREVNADEATHIQRQGASSPFGDGSRPRWGRNSNGTSAAVLRVLHKQTLYPHLVRQQRLPLCVRGRVHEAPSGNQAHSFHRQTRDLTTGPPAIRNALPFPRSVIPPEAPDSTLTNMPAR